MPESNAPDTTTPETATAIDTPSEGLLNIGPSINEAVEILTAEVAGWVETAVESIPNMIVALLALSAAYVLGRIAAKGSRKIFHRAFESEALVDLFCTLVKALVIALGFFIALEMVGLQKAVVSLLAGAGIIGLAIGFAFQDLAENFLAGLMLAIRKPFQVGDVIESNGFMGTVDQLNLRNTIIKDFDGQLIYIPNKDVFKTPLENYAATMKRRITLRVGVSYGEDIEHVRSVLQTAVRSLDFLADEEKADAWAMEFGDSSINFDVRYWIGFPDGKANYLDAIHEGISAIKQAFDEEDIMIPFPIRTLDFGIKGGERFHEELQAADFSTASAR